MLRAFLKVRHRDIVASAIVAASVDGDVVVVDVAVTANGAALQKTMRCTHGLAQGPRSDQERSQNKEG